MTAAKAALRRRSATMPLRNRRLVGLRVAAAAQRDKKDARMRSGPEHRSIARGASSCVLPRLAPIINHRQHTGSTCNQGTRQTRLAAASRAHTQRGPDDGGVPERQERCTQGAEQSMYSLPSAPLHLSSASAQRSVRRREECQREALQTACVRAASSRPRSHLDPSGVVSRAHIAMWTR